MSEVGIRALKQNASAVVARVEAGETLTVTDRGRPVARLSPIRRGRLDELRESGLLRPAKRPGGLLALPPPEPGTGESLSEVLRQMRDDEQY